MGEACEGKSEHRASLQSVKKPLRKATAGFEERRFCAVRTRFHAQ